MSLSKESATQVANESKTQYSLTLDADESKVAGILSDLWLMNLRPEDFVGCRIAPNGMISIVDAIRVARGCSQRAANLMFKRNITISEGNARVPFEFIDIPQYNDKIIEDVPCTSFFNLLRIFAILPDKKFDPL